MSLFCLNCVINVVLVVLGSNKMAPLGILLVIHFLFLEMSSLPPLTHSLSFSLSLSLIHARTHTQTDVTSPPKADLNFLTHFTAKGGPSIFEWSTLSMWSAY